MTLRHLFLSSFLSFVFALVSNCVAFSQNLEIIHSFNGTNGANPESSLILSSNGSFYGVTRRGGSSNLGTIFAINSAGIHTTLISFNGTNGSDPRCRLLESTDGFLYGTTSFGGDSGSGTVFKITTNGVLTTLASFDGINGKVPYAGLSEGTNGAFYGTTFGFGGSSPTIRGTIFRITREGAFTTIKSFTSNEPNGRSFQSGLTLGPDGNFYGVDAQNGGFFPNDKGTVFRVTHEGDFKVIFNFNGTNGKAPVADLLLGSDNKFYGSTSQGSTNGYGTLFQITTNAQLSTLFTFSFAPRGIGHTPETDLLRDENGDIYGATHYPDAAGGWGSIFKLGNDGNIWQLALFDVPSGASKRSGLIRGGDDNFYGQSPTGGAFNKGFVYRIVMPKLTISKQTNDEFVLSWPTNQVGFTLQSAMDLDSSTNWMDSTNVPIAVGIEFVVTNSISGNERFYRLKK